MVNEEASVVKRSKNGKNSNASKEVDEFAIYLTRLPYTNSCEIISGRSLPIIDERGKDVWFASALFEYAYGKELPYHTELVKGHIQACKDCSGTIDNLVWNSKGIKEKGIDYIFGTLKDEHDVKAVLRAVSYSSKTRNYLEDVALEFLDCNKNEYSSCIDGITQSTPLIRIIVREDKGFSSEYIAVLKDRLIGHSISYKQNMN